MDNDIIRVFDNPEFGHLRVTMQDGEPWFVAKDAREVLETVAFIVVLLAAMLVMGAVL